MSAKFAFVIPDVVRGNAVSSNVLKSINVDPTRQHVRRPLGAMEATEDNYATLSLRVAGAPRQIKNTSSPSGASVYNANFMVESINFSTQEKTQLAQTFDRDRMFFYGQALPTVAVTARVIDNATFQWLQEFHHNYTTYIGGSRAAERGGQVQLRVDGKIFTGYLMNMTFNKVAMSLHQTNLNFSMSVMDTKFSTKLAHNTKVLRASGDKEDLAESLANVSEILGEQSQLLRNRQLAKGDLTLQAQVQLINASLDPLSDITSQLTQKTVPLRDAYPDEFPYDEQGRAYDELSEQKASISAFGVLEELNNVRGGNGLLTINEMDMEPDGRDVVVKALVDERVQLGRVQDRRLASAVSPEDIFTPYVKPVPSSLSPYLAAATAVGAAAAYLAVSSLATGFAEEAMAPGDFSAERAGKRVMDKALGTSTLNPPFDDSKVIAGLA